MQGLATFPTFESQFENALNYIARKDDTEIREKQRSQVALSTIFKTVHGVNGEINFTEMQMNSVTQPYQKGWQVKGGIKFVPNKWPIRYGKINDSFNPLGLRNLYLAAILKIDNKVAQKNLLAQYYFKALGSTSAVEIDDTLINGKFVEPVADEPGHYLTVCDGLKQVVKSEVAKGKVAVIGDNTVMTNVNIGQVLKELWEKLPADMRRNPNLRCFMFEDTETMYREWYEKEYGVMTDYVGIDMKIRHTGCQIQVLPYGLGSNMILFTVKDNIKIFDCQPGDVKTTNAEYSKDEMHVSMHYGTGIGFVISGNASVVKEQYVWVNKSCDFLQEAEPDFTIKEASSITATGAKISGTAVGDSMNFVEVGVEYKVKTATDWTSKPVTSATSAVVATLTGLTAETDYVARIFGRTPAGTFYSETVEFSTIA